MILFAKMKKETTHYDDLSIKKYFVTDIFVCF